MVQNDGHKPLRVGGVTIGPGEAVLLPDNEIGQKLAARSDVVLESAPARWQRVRELDGVPGTPTVISPEHRRRGFAVGTADGTVALYYSTSGRRLLLDRWTSEPVTALTVDPKDDGGGGGGRW